MSPAQGKRARCLDKEGQLNEWWQAGDCPFWVCIWKAWGQEVLWAFCLPPFLLLSASPLFPGRLLPLVFCLQYTRLQPCAADHRVKLGFGLSFILHRLVPVCGRNCPRVSKHPSDSQLSFLLRTSRAIRSSNLIICRGWISAHLTAPCWTL